MATVLVSEAETVYVLHGVQENLRCDGRGRKDVRPIVVETDIVTHASGSAHLRLANTDVLVGIKAELEVPFPESPNEGRLEFFVDCSANATPEFEGRGGNELATEISRILTRAYRDPRVFDLKSLCLLPGRQCWLLYVDILILECGGNLYDAVSMAVKAALYSTLIPKISVTAVDGGEPELELSDDPYDGHKLVGLLEKAPVLVTLSRIGNYCVVDPTPEEEACSSASLVISVTPKGKITTVRKMGAGCFHNETLIEAMAIAVEIGKEIHAALQIKLQQENRMGVQREKYGFIK